MPDEEPRSGDMSSRRGIQSHRSTLSIPFSMRAWLRFGLPSSCLAKLHQERIR